MAFKLRDELMATPPKLSLSSFPSHLKPLPPTPGALTPPLQPMLAIPFSWEEEPGRPKPITISTPLKPKSFRCLELPPRLLVETKVASGPYSPTTVLDGPKVAQTLSHRFFLEDKSPNCLMDNESGLDKGLGPKMSENELRSYIGPWRWASCNGTKWNEMVYKPNDDFPKLWDKSTSVRSNNVDIEKRMARFRRRTKGSLYKLSNKSSRFIESVYRSLEQIVVRRRKEAKLSSGAP